MVYYLELARRLTRDVSASLQDSDGAVGVSWHGDDQLQIALGLEEDPALGEGNSLHLFREYVLWRDRIEVWLVFIVSRQLREIRRVFCVSISIGAEFAPLDFRRYLRFATKKAEAQWRRRRRPRRRALGTVTNFRRGGRS